MYCNLFDRIINAIKPGKETELPSDTSETWPLELQIEQTSQPSPEDSTEILEASEEPFPEFQEAVNPAHPYHCQD